MFTGIIEEIGSVVARKKEGQGYSLCIQADKILHGTSIGDSISVNGICLTVTNVDRKVFTVDMVEESRSRTTAERSTAEGKSVNLERAMQYNGRLHGHLVQGHIDNTTTIVRFEKKIDSWEIHFTLENDWKQYIIEKGSIAVDGVSLTVSECTDSSFRVSVIPHTIQNTIIHGYREREEVNLEFDILGKYVLNALGQAGQARLVSMNKLALMGY